MNADVLMSMYKNDPRSFKIVDAITLSKPQHLHLKGLVGSASQFILAAVLAGWFLIFLRRHFQRKNLEKNIRKFESPLGSYHQFSKDLRLLKRGVVFSETVSWSEAQTKEYIDKLDEIYRMYILREYIVPALKWSPGQIAKHLHKKFKKEFRYLTPSFFLYSSFLLILSLFPNFLCLI